MKDTTKGATRIMEFDSVAELADVADKHGDREYYDSAKRVEWTGITMTDTIRLAREGWSDALAETMALAESAVTMADQEHMTDSFNQPVWDVTGAQVDIGAFLAGTPECMVDYPLTRTSNQGRVITLAVSSIISMTISKEALAKRGQVTTALAFALARLGHAVEIWVDSVGKKDGKTIIQRVLVKGVNDELDPAAIMFALGHPAFHRQLVVPVRHALADVFSAVPSPRPVKFAATYPEGTIFLPELKSNKDVPEAGAFLRKYLGELGLLAE